MWVDCWKKERPKWWAPAVLMAPIVTPYFIFKARRHQAAILTLMFLISFTAVVGAEVYLYMSVKETRKYDHLPPLTRQIMRASDTLKNTNHRLDKGMVHLKEIAKTDAWINEMKNTIDFISELKIIMTQNQAAIQHLVKLASNYQPYWVKKELNWVVLLQQFYTHRNVRNHYASLERYLDAFNALLVYIYENFDSITKIQSRSHLKNYDEYYLRYRRAADSYNRLNVARMTFQNTFVHKDQKVKPYLPKLRQTETFRLLVK